MKCRSARWCHCCTNCDNKEQTKLWKASMIVGDHRPACYDFYKFKNKETVNCIFYLFKAITNGTISFFSIWFIPIVAATASTAFYQLLHTWCCGLDVFPFQWGKERAKSSRLSHVLNICLTLSIFLPQVLRQMIFSSIFLPQVLRQMIFSSIFLPQVLRQMIFPCKIANFTIWRSKIEDFDTPPNTCLLWWD